MNTTNDTRYPLLTATPAQNTAHTPGPWIIREDGNGQYNVEHESNDLRSIIAVCSDFNLCPEHGGLLSNARLIAAAPELLAALEALYYAGNSCDPRHEARFEAMFCKARAALALAKGGAK